MSSQFTSWIEQSKESLSVAGPICNEANDLLSTSQNRIERAAILWAQTAYLKTIISGQFHVLKTIIKSVGACDIQVKKEFDVGITRRVYGIEFMFNKCV